MKKVLFFLCTLVVVASADQLINLKIEGMMCPACVKNVKSSLHDVNGVKETTVYLKEGKAEVKTVDGINPEAMCAAVKKAGYGCAVAK